MEFHTWINKVIEEWLKSGRSETQLSREIGIGQATLNAMKNRTRGIPRERKIIDAMVEYFKDSHPEVYDILNVSRPVDPRSTLLSAGFPPEFVEAILAARAEFSTELSKRGITQDSPEAREIIKQAFARHGVQLTDTEPTTFLSQP